MVSKQSDQGRIDESTLATTPISTGNETVSRYGQFIKSSGDFFSFDPKLAQLYFGDSYEQQVARAIFVKTLSYAMVDGLPLKYAIGDDSLSNISNADAGGGLYDHTLTIRDPGSKQQSFVDIEEDYDTNGTRTDRDHTLGCVSRDLTLTLDDTQGYGMLMALEQLFGLKPEDSIPANPTITYPNGTDTDKYRRTSDLIFNWDTAGSNDDLSSKHIFAQFNLANAITPIPDLSSNSIYHADYNYTTRTLLTGNFKLLRKSSSVVYADYQNWIRNADGNSKLDQQYRIFKNATEYIDIQPTDCLYWVKRNVVDLGNTEIPVWDVNWTSDSWTIVKRDTLNDAAYWGVV